MKKKVSVLLAVALILILGVAVWYNAPIDLINLDPHEVMEIGICHSFKPNL